MTLTLYHWWGSTCSRKARLCLHEKGVEWQSRHVDLHDFENWAPWYVEIHPKGVVPSLDHDGRIIIESNVVLEYLDDVFPEPPLRPEDAADRARMRVWLDKSEHTVHKYMHLISHNRVHAHRWTEYAAKYSEEQLMAKVHGQPDKARRRDEIHHAEHGISDETVDFAIERLVDELDVMEHDLDNGKWLAGDDYSLADIAIVPFIDRLVANDLGEHIDPSRRPGVADWFARMQARPAFKAAWAFTDPGME